MSTYFPSGKELAASRKWYVVDAAGRTVGHLASEVASILTGKRSPRWTPFMDMGDHVIVINAAKIRLTGMKSESKVYRHYTGYPGCLREEEFNKRMQRKPELVVEEAIKGMLPKSKMGKAMGKKLKVYRGDKHPHQAQQPKALEMPK